MDEGTVREVETMLWQQDMDAELSACRKFLEICQVFLPHGWLRDTVRLVAEGANAEAAWQTLEERTR